jgi:hypothetical protein
MSMKLRDPHPIPAGRASSLFIQALGDTLLGARTCEAVDRRVAVRGGAMPGSNDVCDGTVKPLLTGTHAGDIKRGGQNRQMNSHRGTMPWLAIHLDPALMMMNDAVNGG